MCVQTGCVSLTDVLAHAHGARHQDLLVKNLKRYQKLVGRGNGAIAEELDMLPATYVLPQVRVCLPTLCRTGSHVETALGII